MALRCCSMSAICVGLHIGVEHPASHGDSECPFCSNFSGMLELNSLSWWCTVAAVRHMAWRLILLCLCICLCRCLDLCLCLASVVLCPPLLLSCHCDLASRDAQLTSLGEHRRGSRGNSRSAQRGTLGGGRGHSTTVGRDREEGHQEECWGQTAGERKASRRGTINNNGGAAHAAGQGESYAGEPMGRALK